jgi:hypothetical protein
MVALALAGHGSQGEETRRLAAERPAQVLTDALVKFHLHLVRGGAWFSVEDSGIQRGVLKDDWSYQVGFRCAYNADR